MQEQLLQKWDINANDKILMNITRMYNDRPNMMIIELLKMILGDNILENMAIKNMNMTYIKDKIIPMNVQEFIIGKFFYEKQSLFFVIFIILNTTHIILI